VRSFAAHTQLQGELNEKLSNSICLSALAQRHRRSADGKGCGKAYCQPGAHYILGAAILGEKPPVDTGGENGPDKISSKTDIIQYLKDSFAYVKKAAGTVDERNSVAPIKNPFGEGSATRLALAVGTVGHCSDHYGQLVEYLRMNGIIPPASRQ
jgi:hypothetical protein